MVRRAQYILIVLLSLGLVYTFLPETTDTDREDEFLEQAIACHMEYRPGLEAMLMSQYNIFQVSEGCDGFSADVMSEVLSDSVHVLRSKQLGYEVVFTPRVSAGEVSWSCASTVYSHATACGIEP